ncbi:hypothetical protein JCM18549_12470 [Halolamina salina]
MSLESIDAETALELYLADKENELSEASLTGHKYRLGHFVRWCDEVEGTSQPALWLTLQAYPDLQSRSVWIGSMLLIVWSICMNQPLFGD